MCIWARVWLEVSFSLAMAWLSLLHCSMLSFAALSWHIIFRISFVRGVHCIVDWSLCHLDEAGVSHNLGLSGIFVSISWHGVDIFPVTQKKEKKKKFKCKGHMSCKLPSQLAYRQTFYFIYFYLLVGELFIHSCNERTHKCSNAKAIHMNCRLPSQLVWTNMKVCRESACQAKQAAYKADAHQPRDELVALDKEPPCNAFCSLNFYALLAATCL